MDPRGTVGSIYSRIYKEDHYTLLQTKCGFGEDLKILKVFPMTPPGRGPVWTPGAPLAAFIKKSIIHWSTQHMKALGHMVSENKIFFMFDP